MSFIPTDINECYSSPCQNGGTCEDLVNGYTCYCLSGYSGDHCQIGKTPSLIVSYVSSFLLLFQYNTIQLYCLYVEIFAFWLVIYIKKHSIQLTIKHRQLNKTRS